MTTRVLMGALIAALTLAVAACGRSSPEPESTAAPAAEDHSEHAGAKVFFVSPKNGETIKTTHRFEFGNDMYTIAAVPEGELTPEQVRAGMGHYHLGIDVDCVPVGEEIPRGVPDWVHFGTGSNFIEMQGLKPGQHKFSLQAGDDLHRGVAGLCETITVTVAE